MLAPGRLHRDTNVREILVRHRHHAFRDFSFMIESCQLPIDVRELRSDLCDTVRVLLREIRQLATQRDGVLDEVVGHVLQ